MVKQDKDNITYQALKEHFKKMTIKNKDEKSKSVGETMNLKINTKN